MKRSTYFFIAVLGCWSLRSGADTMDYKGQFSINSGDTITQTSNTKTNHNYNGMNSGFSIKTGSSGTSLLPVFYPGNQINPGSQVTASANSTTDALGLQDISVTAPLGDGVEYTISACTCGMTNASATFSQSYAPSSFNPIVDIDAQVHFVTSGSSCNPGSQSWVSQSSQNLTDAFLPNQRVCAAVRVTYKVGMGTELWQTVQTTRYPYCDCSSGGVATSGYST